MNVIVSAHDKTGLEKICQFLVKKGWKIYASGGTSKYLEGHAIKVERLEGLTGFSELLDGRVKTLHPAVHAGILSRGNEKDSGELKKAGFPEFDIVIANLYNFPEDFSPLEFGKAIELIDIGGQALIRGAAKNHARVAVITNPLQYETVMQEIEAKKGISPGTRQKLALEAFEYIASMDVRIANFFQKNFSSGFPANYFISGRKIQDCRYGENPSQKAAVYCIGKKPFFSFKQLQCKELSYNNFLDFEAAINAAFEFEKPCCAIIKHNTVCGLAEKKNAHGAFLSAWNTDSKSAFGSVIAFNTALDGKTAAEISEFFIEGVAATGFEKEAIDALEKKKNLRLLEIKKPAASQMELRSINSGFLVQEKMNPNAPEIEYATKIKLSNEQLEELFFAWKTVKHVKSNAIVLSKNHETIGIGTGQVSRVDAVEQAIRKAGTK